MISYILKKIVGTKNERELQQIQPILKKINALEPEISNLRNSQLQAKTGEFREKIARGAMLDDILPEAFAVVREASRRTLGMRHFDVQVIGAMVLHNGRIAEMKTGEGKTLVATMPVYLNALSGKGVHVITVNDYLARRDAEWMGTIYKFLGMRVGVILHGLNDSERKAEYNADITYGTNNEFGFDYLRDNMKFRIEDMVQREFNYAIVDEVDSILVDEARTPLIISGPAEESTDKYYQLNRIVPNLKKETDFTIDEKSRSVALTENGVAKAESLLNVENLFDPQEIESLHHINQALRAHNMFRKDVDYIVKDGQVVIVDEFTGRLMPGRRWSDGLHQAIEAKENVKIENENQTLATITFQNYFRMYNKLAGMTGTADTEAAEFKKIYNLDVIVVPTNLPMIRIDNSDVVYRTEKEKFNAIIEEIVELHKNGRPVLVGTISIEKSEILSRMLSRRGIKHNVLNAKQHEKEAMIIAQAGRLGAVTIATNMAGRGVDILLGGNPDLLARERMTPDTLPEESEKIREEMRRICAEEKKKVIGLGGLHILGTERHESRRIDNQLRGRSGRQGDPGSSRFYLSLEDDLLRLFGSDRISGMMQKLGMEEGIPIEHRWITRAIENAQKKVEAHNFEIRKNLLEYDDVMNKQREIIYSQRKAMMKGEGIREEILTINSELVDGILFTYTNEKVAPEEWDWNGVNDAFYRFFNSRLNIDTQKQREIEREELSQLLLAESKRLIDAKEHELSEHIFLYFTRILLLQTIDSMWKDHLLNMDHLREGIGLRGYAQRDPLIEYKREAFNMFEEMISHIREETMTRLLRIQIRQEQPPEAVIHPLRQKLRTNELHAGIAFGGQQVQTVAGSAVSVKKVGRNDPCPCGSGKKYKKCHGSGA
ncbi:MAG TPA: preprotein translocase subunit SecA [bacterium]